MSVNDRRRAFFDGLFQKIEQITLFGGTQNFCFHNSFLFDIFYTPNTKLHIWSTLLYLYFITLVINKNVMRIKT